LRTAARCGQLSRVAAFGLIVAHHTNFPRSSRPTRADTR
jgi:hypothetical protein